jgi:hypothetical protein
MHATTSRGVIRDSFSVFDRPNILDATLVDHVGCEVSDLVQESRLVDIGPGADCDWDVANYGTRCVTIWESVLIDSLDNERLLSLPLYANAHLVVACAVVIA